MKKNEQKTFYIIAGANGSGKTTFALSFVKLEKINFINADELAKKYDSSDIQKYKIKAGKDFFKQLKVNLSKDKSFAIETTLSGKYLLKYIKKARENRFKIVLTYIFLENIQEHILRVNNRLQNGGHFVPKDDIIRRFYRSRTLFAKVYKHLVDRWEVFYNGYDGFKIVENENMVFDEELKNLFEEK